MKGVNSPGRPRQPGLPFRFGKMFDGVPERGPWHFRGMGGEKPAQNLGTGVLSDLSEHPAHCFVHQVVFVAKEKLCDFEGVFALACADEGFGGDDRDAALPKVGGDGKL